MLRIDRKCVTDLRTTCILFIFFNAINASFIGLLPPSMYSATLPIARQRQVPYLARYAAQKEKSSGEIFDEIQLIAQELWKGDEIATLCSSKDRTTLNPLLEGEAELEDGVIFQDRAEYFLREALKGCPKSQHSYGLLLWSGFADVQKNAEASAKFHAAAAFQKHLDGMAVLGGCLRTGTGVKRNVELGLKIIDYCVAAGNPTGINKKAALLESNQDELGALQLYEDCFKSGRLNALLLFNLGWSLINGPGEDRDRGISLWKSAARMAPDEGSEEASWYLYQEYKRDDPIEARKWLDLAKQLGYEE